MLKDAQARAEATDPTCSFIVQAPAGSGKTELLTQRYLRLLNTVNSPEEIVALTFTRKAASEMRSRILSALKDAELNTPTHSPHQALTRGYALNVLIRDSELKWHLLKQPSRLIIITIDALCQLITQAMPLHHEHVAHTAVSDNPSILYEMAARYFISESINNPQDKIALMALLQHLDNRQDKLIQLLSHLLATRDQWEPILSKASTQTQAFCEQALLSLEQEAIEQLKKCLGFELINEIGDVGKQIATIENNKTSERHVLTTYQDVHSFDRAMAKGFAALLLTKDDNLRKQFDHHVGLKRGHCPDLLYSHLKARGKKCLEVFLSQPNALDRLLWVKNLPLSHYTPLQWSFLQQLLTVLPTLLRCLNNVFESHNAVDFTAISTHALAALSKASNDYLLTAYLKYPIHHLLIDEFQDTSLQQFSLIETLVKDWQPNDKKTLFLVGDPMQSIYRFRQAEVALFLNAKERGIGKICLKPIQLLTNFRSKSTIVEWVNTQFKSIFPLHDDKTFGSISLNSSVAHQDNTGDTFIKAHSFDNKYAEAIGVAGIVQSELEKDPKSSIAILVRSRNQLQHILKILREKKIAFEGIDIEKLSHLAHLRDLFVLSSVLLAPSDRLSWFSFLRSPWCGLTLSDLEAITTYDHTSPFLHVLAKLSNSTINNSTLSNDGILRIRFIYTTIHAALNERQCHSLTHWILDTAKKLHFFSILTAEEQKDLQPFWDLLTRYSKKGYLSQRAAFEKELASLYSNNLTPARVQIMTIHKSKGLEFDCVILPGLGSKSTAADKPLLRCFNLTSDKNPHCFILSPICASYETTSPLYDYIGNISKSKDYFEQQRLLYVAVTRAKKRLYLTDHHEAIKNETFRFFLKDVDFTHQTLDIAEQKNTVKEIATPPLYRLPLSYYKTSLSEDESISQTVPIIPFPDVVDEKIYGIITHTLLESAGKHHIKTIDALPWDLASRQFFARGYDKSRTEKAIMDLKQLMSTFFENPIGQWICEAHVDEQTEYPLLIKQDDKIYTRIIDRTFYYQKSRWIIDYKTGFDDANHQNEHKKQLKEYASIWRTMRDEPIQCGIFYLATNRFIHFEYTHREEISFS